MDGPGNGASSTEREPLGRLRHGALTWAEGYLLECERRGYLQIKQYSYSDARKLAAARANVPCRP